MTSTTDIETSGPRVDLFKPLFLAIRNALIQQPSLLAAFEPIFNVTPYDINDPPFPFATPDTPTLLSFIENEFPCPAVSSSGLWLFNVRLINDPTTLFIHGRLADALLNNHSEQNLILLRFIIVTIILHQLGHAMSVRFSKPSEPVDDNSKFPYHFAFCCPPLYRFPEQGFAMEEVLFGGIIGVVFEDEVDGKPPMLVESDFTKISYLFLHCRDGSTYKLDPIDLQHKMDMAHFVPFDVSRLEAIPAPQPIRDRTCAMLNADHLPAPRDQRHPTMFPYAFNDRAAFEIGCGIQRAPPGARE